MGLESEVPELIFSLRASWSFRPHWIQIVTIQGTPSKELPSQSDAKIQ